MQSGIRKIIFRALAIIAALFMLLLFWCRFFPAPPTYYAISEWMHNDDFKRDWIDTSELDRHIYASIIASEDAGFCQHNGIEWKLMWQLFVSGEKRGGSTISQQMVKNLFLWHGQNKLSRYSRKLLEIPLTMLVEIIYPKERILEIYLNIVEFDTGVFGVEAAALHHFNLHAKDLSPYQMALLTAVLPNPKIYSAAPPGEYVAKRAREIEQGQHTVISRDLDQCVHN